VSTASLATTTERGRAIVAQRRPAALALGRRAGDRAANAGAVVVELRSGLADLADPEYLAGQQRVAPGIGALFGVRQPLLSAVTAGMRAATRRDSTTTLLEIADRLLREDQLELHWLAFPLIERAIRRDPEQAWQLIRREASHARDWITVDSLAHVAGRGILAEPYRWAELEQLVYSPSSWERRLVASTLATIPYVDRKAGREPEVVRRGLRIIGELVGDAAPEVQKGLAWALRSLTLIDPRAVATFLRLEAAQARTAGDGHRAWVIRDAVGKLPTGDATAIRAAVAGIRRRPGAPSTSRAAATAAEFAGLGVDVPPAERPLVPRP
jgi:3-methyladenine DNA glycosylase AlkD